MCRLLGIIANREVDLRFSLMEGPSTLKTMSDRNPDGWGLGWYEGDAPKLVKEPRKASESSQFYRTAAEARSRIFIGHVRLATTGSRTEENCHPFACNDWLFAHNGTIKDREELSRLLEPSHRRALRGKTDSEVYFHWILQSIESERDVERGIQAAVSKVRRYAHTGLNFILTDGSALYAYREASGSHDYYSLFFLFRTPDAGGPVTFRSKEVGTLLESKALNNERAVLVCSEKLTEEQWEEIPIRHLLVVSRDLAPRMAEVE